MVVTTTCRLVMLMLAALMFVVTGCAEPSSVPSPREQPGQTAPEEGENGGDVKVDVGDDGVNVDVGDDGVNVDVGDDGVNVDVGDDEKEGNATEGP